MWATVFVLPSDPRAGSPIVLPSTSVTIDENGRGSFALLAVPAGRWTLRTQVMNVATLDRLIDVARSSNVSHTIFFEDGMAASVSGRVLSARGTIDAGSIYLSPENGGLAVSATIRAGGDYEMPWVAPGKYMVSVSAYLGGSYESYYAPVEIHGRTMRLDVETVAPPAVAETEWVPENYESAEYQPEIEIDWTTDGAVVSATLDVEGLRIWAGDRVTSIDGETVGADGAAMTRLLGTEGSTCRLRLERPATGETYSIEVPRTRVERRYGCGLSRGGDW
jgi:hypothetical protein